MVESIEFLGAAGGVTGSRSVLRTEQSSILVDCGLFQGPKEVRARNWEPSGIEPKSIHCIVLTHAHLDHSGYLPRFVREGYDGPIYCSEGTAELLPIMLFDAAHLEKEFARYANDTGYSNHRPAMPLFTDEDVEAVLKLLCPLKRHAWHAVANDVSLRFLHAGHIVGASQVQFLVTKEQKSKIVTFSGDLGHGRQKTLRAPESLLETDVLVLESTYGDRLHDRSDSVAELANIANRVFQRGGVLVIPAFSVGRSQEILYLLRLAEDRGMIPAVPVVLDSPMANKATDIYLENHEDHHDMLSSVDVRNAFLPGLFEMTESSDESMLACMRDGPAVVISAAGMLNGGRILHHLKKRLPDERNAVLFCGYQAEGTKGRFLQDNASTLQTLRIHHEEVAIEAEIITMASLSAHADWQDMIDLFSHESLKPRMILLNHGEPTGSHAFAKRLQGRFPKTEIKVIDKPQLVKLG